MGHLFNCCPFVDDKLKRLFREEVMNTHQLVFPTTTIAIPNVFVLKIQAMNPNISHIAIPVNYQITQSQLIIPSKTNMLPTSTYSMWSNVIPPYVPLNLSLYPAYQIGTKGLDYLILRNYKGSLLGIMYLVLE
jgi:hypothetical protein